MTNRYIGRYGITPYDKFVGLEVSVTESEGVNACAFDKVIGEIEALAVKEKHFVRILFPNSRFTSEVCTDRLNVSVEKNVDGVWVIESVRFG